MGLDRLIAFFTSTPNKDPDSKAIDTPSSQLSKWIREHGKIGFHKQQFMTDESLSKLITEPFISRVLPKKYRQTLASYAIKNKKILAITLLTFDDADRVGVAMSSLRDGGFQECDLPVDDLQESEGNCKVQRGQLRSGCNHRKEYNAFHQGIWDHAAFGRFYDNQWRFLLQKFEVKVFDYSLHERRILPLKISKDYAGHGGFGVVSPVEMLCDHQDAFVEVKSKMQLKI